MSESAHPLVWLHENHSIQPWETFGSVMIYRGTTVDDLCSSLIHSRDRDYLGDTPESAVMPDAIAIWLTLHKECRLIRVDALQADGLAAHVLSKHGLIAATERAKSAYTAKKARP